MTFTFRKQTKDNFISRKFQCRPTYSFIHSFSCPLFLWGESLGPQPRRPEISHNQQHLR